MKRILTATLVFLTQPVLGSPTSDLQEKISQQEKQIQAIDKSIALLDQQGIEAEKLHELENNMLQQEDIISDLENQQKLKKQEIFQNYAETERNVQEYLSNQREDLSQLSERLRIEQANAQEESTQVRRLQQSGIAFDEIPVRNKRLEETLQRVDQLQKNIEAQTLQNEQEKALIQRDRIWQVNTDLDNLQSQTRQKIELERTKLADLRKKYDTLQEQEEARKRKREELQEEFLSQQRIYDQLLARYQYLRRQKS